TLKFLAILREALAVIAQLRLASGVGGNQTCRIAGVGQEWPPLLCDSIGIIAFQKLLTSRLSKLVAFPDDPYETRIPWWSNGLLRGDRLRGPNLRSQWKHRRDILPLGRISKFRQRCILRSRPDTPSNRIDGIPIYPRAV